SGLYFPVRALGPWAFLAFAVLPLSLGLDAMRQLLLGTSAHPFLSVRLEIALLAASGVLFVIIAAVAWRVMEERAKHEGRLTGLWKCWTARGRPAGSATSARPPGSAGRWRATGPILTCSRSMRWRGHWRCL